MKERVANIPIPLYDLVLELVVTDDSSLSQRKRARKFGLTDVKAVPGCFCSDEYNFGLIFTRRAVNHDLIGHEIFHATHGIMNYLAEDESFKVTNQEPYAYLAGWISREVYFNLKKWKIRIK